MNITTVCSYTMLAHLINMNMYKYVINPCNENCSGSSDIKENLT